MHEAHVVEALVKGALESAQKAGATSITKVTIAIGELTGFHEDSIRLYFDQFSLGTMLEKAELSFKNVPAKLQCKSCNTLFEHAKDTFTCPNCCALGFLTNSGKEFYIENLEIETP